MAAIKYYAENCDADQTYEFYTANDQTDDASESPVAEKQLQRCGRSLYKRRYKSKDVGGSCSVSDKAIGWGRYGTVYRGKYEGKPCAVKVFLNTFFI